MAVLNGFSKRIVPLSEESLTTRMEPSAIPIGSTEKVVTSQSSVRAKEEGASVVGLRTGERDVGFFWQERRRKGRSRAKECFFRFIQRYYIRKSKER